jgi:predicted metalloprotease
VTRIRTTATALAQETLVDRKSGPPIWLFIAGALIALGLAACGSTGGSDQRTQPRPDVARAAATPYSDLQHPNAVISSAVNENQSQAGFHRLMDGAADSINHYWGQAVPRIFNQRYVPPRFVGAYVPGRDHVVCGGRDAAERGNAFFCAPDNFIAYDEPTFMYKMFKEVDPLAPAFILAHEWGHAIQHQLGVRYPNTIQSELGADCFSGAWAAYAAEHDELTREDFDQAVATMTSLQDPNGVPWLDPGAHGTAFERRAFGNGTSRPPCIVPEGG